MASAVVFFQTTDRTLFSFLTHTHTHTHTMGEADIDATLEVEALIESRARKPNLTNQEFVALPTDENEEDGIDVDEDVWKYELLR